MIYTKECNVCQHTIEIVCSISQHEVLVKPTTLCPICSVGDMKQVLEPSLEIRKRTPFPKGFSENATYESGPGIYMRDRVHAREVLAERGLGSKFIDDGG